MSTTGQGAGPDSDATQRIRRPGTQSGQNSALRDGAMARTAPRRDLERRARAAGGAGAGAPPLDAPVTAPVRTSTGAVGAGAGAAIAARPGQPQARGAGSAQRQAAGARGQGGGPQGGGAPRQPRPSGPRPQGVRRGPRRVRLTVQRIDPWSVMKISFLVSVALGIAMVVAVSILWGLLSNMQVLADLNDFIQQITEGEDGSAPFDLMAYLGFGRVVSAAVVLGVINVALLTALATLTAFLYNICAALVGGARLTLSDE